jgi:hypothetical protein
MGFQMSGKTEPFFAVLKKKGSIVSNFEGGFSMFSGAIFFSLNIVASALKVG